MLETWERARKYMFGLMRLKLPTLGMAGLEHAGWITLCAQCKDLGQGTFGKSKKA